MESLESNTGDLSVASLLCDCFTLVCVDRQQLKVQATKTGREEAKETAAEGAHSLCIADFHSCIACHILITQPKVAIPKKKDS